MRTLLVAVALALMIAGVLMIEGSHLPEAVAFLASPIAGWFVLISGAAVTIGQLFDNGQSIDDIDDEYF